MMLLYIGIAVAAFFAGGYVANLVASDVSRSKWIRYPLATLCLLGVPVLIAGIAREVVDFAGVHVGGFGKIDNAKDAVREEVGFRFADFRCEVDSEDGKFVFCYPRYQATQYTYLLKCGWTSCEVATKQEGFISQSDVHDA